MMRIQPLPVVQGVSIWMASGRHHEVSEMASYSVPSGMRRRASSTMYPPMSRPGAG